MAEQSGIIAPAGKLTDRGFANFDNLPPPPALRRLRLADSTRCAHQTPSTFRGV